jgi:cytochrome c biogenesis protein ResB
LKLKKGNNQIEQIPLKKITKNGRKFWFSFLTLPEAGTRKLSVVVNDLQGEIYIYNEKGTFLTKTFLGKKVVVMEGIDLTFVEFLTSTGLQIKVDPGINTVYVSFLFLMISVYASFVTYSQIWMSEKNQTIMLAGNSNRAVLFFQSEFRKLVNQTSKLN